MNKMVKTLSAGVLLCALLVLSSCLSKKEAEEIGKIIATDIRNAYEVELDNWAAAYPDSLSQPGICGYFVCDINRDSIPELFIVGGTCEADKTIGIYSYTLEGVDSLLVKHASHAVFYAGDGYVLSLAANGGEAYETRLTLVADSINIEPVYVGPLSDETGYKDPTEPRVTLLPYADRSEIAKILNEEE